MESALRTAYNLITGKELEKIEFTEVRGFTGFKEAVVKVGDLELKDAVVNTAAQAGALLDRIKKGEAEYDFVEVMACPGGCLGGGGQMLGYEPDRIKERIESIYKLEKTRKVRMSYRNEEIKALYQDYLKFPGSPRSHELLHTHYCNRPQRS